MQNLPDNNISKLYAAQDRCERKTIFIALLATLLFHALLFIAIPSEFPKSGLQPKPETLQVSVLPPLETKKHFPEYIEANPFGNNLKPKAQNAKESYKDQRAADEIPDKNSDSQMPFVGGEKKDSNKIVSGTYNNIENPLIEAEEISKLQNRPLANQSETLPENSAQNKPENSAQNTSQSSSEKSDNANKSVKAPSEKSAKLQEALNGGISKEILSDKGEIVVPKKGENAEKSSVAKAPKETPEKAEKPAEKQESKKELANQEQNEPPLPQNLPKPKVRPSINFRVAPGPLSDNKIRASMQGTVSADSRFSEFGAYQQRMIEAISRQWNLLGSTYNLSGAVGTHIMVEFYLNKHGQLTRIETLFTNSTQTGTALCEQSILTTAPYGEWTRDMIDAFGGDAQPVKIVFYYR